jgi:hypothetical protein
VRDSQDFLHRIAESRERFRPLVVLGSFRRSGFHAHLHDCTLGGDRKSATYNVGWEEVLQNEKTRWQAGFFEIGLGRTQILSRSVFPIGATRNISTFSHHHQAAVVSPSTTGRKSQYDHSNCTVGKDGFVLGADVKRAELYSDTEVSSSVPKIYTSRHGVLVGAAENDVARSTAEILTLNIDQMESAPADLFPAIQRAARQATERPRFQSGRSLGTILTLNPNARQNKILKYEFETGPHGFRDDHPIMCSDKMVAGYGTSPALFFLEQYYSPDLPLDVLAVLAGHVITATEAFHPGRVGGLEIAIVHYGYPPKFVTTQTLAEIQTMSHAIIELVKSSLLRPIDSFLTSIERASIPAKRAGRDIDSWDLGL